MNFLSEILPSQLDNHFVVPESHVSLLPPYFYPLCVAASLVIGLCVRCLWLRYHLPRGYQYYAKPSLYPERAKQLNQEQSSKPTIRNG